MARIINRKKPGTPSSGFSLIEIMIAVVVLATGLLALAALQGALARNSADAKARGAVMAALMSQMNDVRQSPPADGTTTATCSGGNWVCAAEAMGSINSLTVTQTVTTKVWKSSAFSDAATGDDLTGALFKRVGMSAQWTDSSNTSKTLALSSDVSVKVYGDGSGYPTNDPNGSSAKYPIVRQDNPSNTAGVIPIVTGDQATAASNPQPIIEGSDEGSRVGTSFDVLNYVPEGSTAKITKRFQTEVIKCRCQYGVGGYSVAGEAQWPATWDGTTYSVYAGSGDATGVALNAGEDEDYAGTSGNGNGKGNKSSGRQQSEQCTECCRDHHDASGTATEARYDPEATAVGKYDEANGVLTAQTNTSSGKYVAACRVVKVDGLWRTAADMYERQFGLLETTSTGGVQAKSGIPSTTATTAYQAFVKDYLKQYTGTSTTAPTGAQTMFDEDTRGLNNPATVSIAAPTSDDSDWRYLHGRGLFVDYLTGKAQTAVGKAITKCPTGTDLAECILPVLPFTTINLTEMATWAASSTTVLELNTTKALLFNTSEPYGGRTAGRASGTATNTSTMRTSNSGVAVNDDIPGAVDSNGDAATLSDSQSFTVGGTTTTPTGSDVFYVKIAGGGDTTKPTYTSPAGAGSCTYQDADTGWRCTTQSAFPQGVTLILKDYVVKDTSSASESTSTTCTYKGDPKFVTASITKPTFTNYSVTSAAIGGTNAYSITPENNAMYNETTTIVFSSVAKDATINVTLDLEGSPSATTTASVSTCTTNNKSNQINNATWNKTWCPTQAGNPYTGCL